ncbi:site-specific integrase [Occultella aeris]|uniref:Prophage phiRv2 integrase n=1 Tax=Occultella aeris TaxID=2761496 RepID=A0A7M4DKP7_9MICO|nr:site-specific integrase [Occultella aeris]VZO37738.1 Putative prophage phiRv2 integrase [Occultella aeris]
MPKKRTKLPRGIDRRTGGMYRARVTYEGRQYAIGNYFTIGDAKAALSIARSEIARCVFIAPTERRKSVRDAATRERVESVTVREWADDWLVRLADEGRSPGTTRSYRSTLDVHVLPTLGDVRMVDVVPEDIDVLLKAVRAKRGPWANVARTVRTMFRAAVAAKIGGVTVSPVNVSIPKDTRASASIDTEEVASPAEVRAMAAAMPQHLRIAVPLAAWCSLRLGEVLGLQRRDLEHLDDPARAVLHVRRQWHTKTSPPGYTDPKAGSRRSIAIPAVVLSDLCEHLAAHAGPGREGPVLPSTRNPQAPISQTSFDKAWRVARDQVRPRFLFHNLRHTGLTTYAAQGATLEELKRRGGHRSTDAAMRYQHATAQRDRALTARMSVEVEVEDAV